MSVETIFRQVERTLWVVTAHDGTRGGGLVATWVSLASVDPNAPTVAIAIAVNHFTRELIDAGQSFALHLLRPTEFDLAWRFAHGSGRDSDKLAGLDWRPGQHGAPILDGAIAWLDCRVYDRHDGGDRIYYWADITDSTDNLTAGDDALAPLTDRQFFALASDEQKHALRDDLRADIEIQRPLFAAWRAGR